MIRCGERNRIRLAIACEGHAIRVLRMICASQLDLPLPEPMPRGAEWIAAYRHRAR